MISTWRKGTSPSPTRQLWEKILSKVCCEASGRRCGETKLKVTQGFQVQHFTSMAAERPHYSFSSQVRLNRAACPTLCRHTQGVLKNEWFQNRKIVKVEKNHSATQIQSPMSCCSSESCKDCLGNSTAHSRSMADISNPACAAARQTWQKASTEIQTPGYHCSSQLQLFTVKKEVSLLQELTSILLIATGSLITACETACFSAYSQNAIQLGLM